MMPSSGETCDGPAHFVLISPSLSLTLSPLSQGCASADLGALSLVHGGEVSGSGGWSDLRRADGLQPQFQGRAVRRGAGAGQLLRRCEWTADKWFD